MKEKTIAVAAKDLGLTETELTALIVAAEAVSRSEWLPPDWADREFLSSVGILLD